MDDMTRETGELSMDYEEVITYLKEQGTSWWCGRFYKNYNGLLDAYITFSDSTRYYHFIMDYDPQDVQIGENYGGYPTPAHFYLAKRAIRTGTSWTFAEYDAIQLPFQMVPAAIAAAAMGDDDAIEQGGDVVLSKTNFPLFLFLSIFYSKSCVSILFVCRGRLLFEFCC